MSGNTERAPELNRPRIVSLLASGTETVSALGLEDQLVGISHECDDPPAILDRPRVSRTRFDADGLSSGEIDAAVRAAMLEYGSVYELDREKLIQLEPDLILTQAVCEVCAVPTAGVKETVDELGLGARVLSLDSHSIGDILESIGQVADAAGAPTAGERLVGEISRRLDAVRGAVAGLPRPSVLAIEWLDPPFCPGHWVPEMIEIAGGDNLVGDASKPSRQLEWSDLVDLDPDVLLVMPCGYDVEQSATDADRHADRLHDVAPRAIESGRAYVVNGSAYLNRSGPRFVRGVEILGALFHETGWPVEHDEGRRWAPKSRPSPRWQGASWPRDSW